MGKVEIPEEGKFLIKICVAIFFFTLLIFWGALMINPARLNMGDSFYESFSIRGKNKVKAGNITDFGCDESENLEMLLDGKKHIIFFNKNNGGAL